MKFISASPTKLKIITLTVLMLCIGIITHTQHASALLPTDIPNSIKPAICQYDSTSGDPNKYQTGGWISQAGAPTKNITINVPYNTQTVNLQLNRWIFVYHEIVSPPGSGPTDGACVISPPYVNGLPPNGAPTGAAVLGLNSTKIDSLTATSGSITNYTPGTVTTISHDNASRYWFNNPVTFTYNNGSPMTTSKSITVTANARSANTFHLFTTNDTYCVAASGPAIPTTFNPVDFTPCPSSASNFTITIVVAPAPTSFMARPCVSPAICDVVQNPDNEAPTTADFTSEILVSISQPTPTVVKGVTVTESYYVRHANGSPNTVLLTVGPRKIDLSPPKQTFVHNGLVLPPGIVPGDEICLSLIVRPQTGTLDSSGNIITPGLGGGPELCDPVFGKPYLTVFQNDVIDGGGFGISPCPQTSGGITAFLGTAGSANSGSGSQLAAFALGSVLFDPPNKIGFASSKLRSGAPPPARPNGLTFANTNPANIGNFGAANCVSQYELPPTPASPPPYNANISGLNSDTYYVSPGLGFAVINSAGQIPKGRQITINVDGNLVIRSNVVYAGSSSWASAGEIPSLTVIARGDIYIDNGVTELDGIYVSHGTIYTCTQDTGKYGLNGIADNCGEAPNVSGPLTVYGSLLAKNIKWYRTYSTLHNSKANEDPYENPNSNCLASIADVCSAETIISGPEEYLPVCDPLTSCSIGGGSTGSGTKYDSITGLPPVL